MSSTAPGNRVATLGLTVAELIATRTPGTAARSAFDPWRNPDSLRPGDLLSKRRGNGFELDSIGPYQPGDDVRHIDWQASARTGRTQVRQLRAELQCTITMIVDLRSSMFFGTRHRLMAKTACLLAARVGWALSPGGYQPVGLICLTDQGNKLYSARRGRGARLRQLQQLCDAYDDARRHARNGDRLATPLDQVLVGVADSTPRRSQSILISDFSAPGSALTTRLREFATGHLHCVVVQDALNLRSPPPGRYPARLAGQRQSQNIKIGGHVASYEERALENWQALSLQLRSATGGQVLSSHPASTQVISAALMPALIAGRLGR